MRKQLVLVTILIFFQLQLSIHAQDEKPAAQQNLLKQSSATNTQVKGIQGNWEGTLEAGGAKVRLVVKVTKKPDGTLTAAMDSPDQGATGIPLDYINFKDNIVTFELKAGGALFEGTLNKEETAIIGQWKQGGGSFALTLNRTVKAPVTLLRPQEPKKPFPYDEEEVSYENKKAGVRLAGSLTLPRTKGPHPVVLLITGSGQQDRNEAMLGHKPFLVLADYLTRRGIAVLRVDDRGIGGSSAGAN
jgi:dipeptidyl aminopeptidase/acylaminoacyl peptidase